MTETFRKPADLIGSGTQYPAAVIQAIDHVNCLLILDVMCVHISHEHEEMDEDESKRDFDIDRAPVVAAGEALAAAIANTVDVPKKLRLQCERYIKLAESAKKSRWQDTLAYTSHHAVCADEADTDTDADGDADDDYVEEGDF